MLWGVGNFVGSTLAGRSQAFHTLAQPQGAIAHDWHGIWIYPAWGAVAVLLIFVLFFHEPPKKTPATVLAGRKDESFETP